MTPDKAAERLAALVTPDLVECLRVLYPRRPYTAKMTNGEIMYAEGQQSMIDALANAHIHTTILTGHSP